MNSWACPRGFLFAGTVSAYVCPSVGLSAPTPHPLGQKPHGLRGIRYYPSREHLHIQFVTNRKFVKAIKLVLIQLALLIHRNVKLRYSG